jgi:hypothetical protein
MTDDVNSMFSFINHAIHILVENTVKPLILITLGQRESDKIVWIITLLELPFQLSKASFRKWDLLKLPNTDYIFRLIIVSVIPLRSFVSIAQTTF